jgi:hypothetical protein
MTAVTLREYSQNACLRFGNALRSGEIFAKILTTNDDSGRHGLLIPSEAYDYFPALEIHDPTQNATRLFSAYDLVASKQTELAYKYYQRYPERRITRLNGKFNDIAHGPIFAIFLKATHEDGSIGYYIECLNAGDTTYELMLKAVFGLDVETKPGSFVAREIDSLVFAYDETLSELAALFDNVRAQGWIESLREGSTGIGYTFESLIGIEENNKQEADYKGIEVKCKHKKDTGGASGKINLFQKVPNWCKKMTGKERIRQIGSITDTGRFGCHSQVTTKVNNLGLKLSVDETEKRIELLKSVEPLGYWPYRVLENCLAKKHARAIFVKADVRKAENKTYFRYDELIYCEQPSMRNFIGLVEDRDLVFEFMMSEQESGSIRNHGYPWRLNREELLKELFAMKIQLR